MSNQVNIPEYYSQAKLQEARAKLNEQRTISKKSAQDFLKAVNNKELHREISPELEKFLNYLNTLIQQEKSKAISIGQIKEALEESFISNEASSTMWQIRFINFVTDSDMRKKISFIDRPEDRAKIAGIQQELKVDCNGDEWNISKHQSFGTQSRSLEPSFHIHFDSNNDTTVILERIDANYNKIEDRALLKDISKIVDSIFTQKNLLRVPDIRFNEDFFNQKRDQKAIIKLMNKRPISELMNQIISKTTREGRILQSITQNQKILKNMINSDDPEASLLDIYLYRIGAHLRGNTIQPYYSPTGEAEPFLQDFNPEDYKGKEGLQKLALEAYEFYKTEFNESKENFMDHILYDYQAEINFQILDKELKNEVLSLEPYKKTSDLNLTVLVDLGDSFGVYTLGDTSIVPVFYQDSNSSSEFFDELDKLQAVRSSDIPRLELGENKGKRPRQKSLKAYGSAILQKDELEALIIASRDLIKNSKKIRNKKNNNPYKKFFKEIISPYIQDESSTQREKDKKLITDMISHTAESNDIGIFVISHKINDNDDDRVNIDEPNPHVDQPWEDAPTGSPNDLLLV